MIHTTKIRGHIVLAKADGFPHTYSNRTQAEKAAAKVGGQVLKFFDSRPFFVVLEEAA